MEDTNGIITCSITGAFINIQPCTLRVYRFDRSVTLHATIDSSVELFQDSLSFYFAFLSLNVGK